MQRVCSYANCSVRPSYGYEWKEPTYCSKHKKENMENVVDKRCIIKGCIKSTYLWNSGRDSNTLLCTQK